MDRLNNLPLVDVIIITFNQEKYIEEAIESVLNQTYSNVNLIIADDCSSDKTRDIIILYEKKHKNKIIKVFNNTNLGITGNSNAALRSCKGEFLVIMGGDDVLYKNKIEYQVKWFAERKNAVLCGHRLNLIDENSNLIGKFVDYPTFASGFDKWIEEGMLFGCMSIMVRRDVHLSFNENLKYASDYLFFIENIGAKGDYGYIKQCLGAYRKHNSSVTHINSSNCMGDLYKTYSYLTVKFPDKKKIISKGLSRYYYRLGLLESNISNKSRFLKLSLKQNIYNYKSYIRLIATFFQ